VSVASLRSGVLVDRWLTTSDPRVTAIGDCAVMCDPAIGTRRRLESIQNATDQGRYAAARIRNGGGVRPAGGSGDEKRFAVFCLRGGRLTAVESVNDPGTHMAARRLLERVTPSEAELVAVDHDVRALARRAMARETAVA
jgi:3-phenylpropionate/trans-cinnamate dioxygenase ferredoxin reductase subunit